MNSGIYRGWVRHRRTADVRHTFRYSVFMMYLDLAELPEVFARRWLWSATRPALARFRRSDYYGDPAVPLDLAVRDLVAERTGRRPDGPIRLLTNLRYFGFVMNPVSFYYCYDAADTRVEAIVAEVTNTPWGERHAYVMTADALLPPASTQRFALAKVLHVSPFFGMDHRYDWRFSAPGHRLVVRMNNLTRRGKAFDATLVLQRHEITGTTLAATLLRHPFMTLKVAAGIYWQAFRLWARGARFHHHPATGKADAATHILH
ncbi:MAG: DUF1365 domain-containing protein [Gemmatimonadota bacterium]